MEKRLIQIARLWRDMLGNGGSRATIALFKGFTAVGYILAHFGILEITGSYRFQQQFMPLWLFGVINLMIVLGLAFTLERRQRWTWYGRTISVVGFAFSVMMAHIWWNSGPIGAVLLHVGYSISFYLQAIHRPPQLV